MLELQCHLGSIYKALFRQPTMSSKRRDRYGSGGEMCFCQLFNGLGVDCQCSKKQGHLNDNLDY